MALMVGSAPVGSITHFRPGRAQVTDWLLFEVVAKPRITVELLVLIAAKIEYGRPPLPGKM